MVATIGPAGNLVALRGTGRVTRMTGGRGACPKLPRGVYGGVKNRVESAVCAPHVFSRMNGAACLTD